MCYHGLEELDQQPELQEVTESAFTDKGNPTYAGFTPQTNASH